MPKSPCTPLFCALVAFSTISTGPLGHAQEQAALTLPDLSASSSSILPDDPAQAAGAQAPHQDVQTKRILGVIPNFRAVTADQHPPAQSVKDKFITASQDSFDYSSILLPVVVAGINQARKNTPEFHQGAAGYGRYFWHSYVDQAVENYSVEFIVPVVTHEDTRYYTLGKGGFLKRAGYSLSRVVVTRSDKGNDTVNLSEIVGAGMGAGISNLYYPSPERTFSNTAQMWGTNIGIDAATFLFKEFWPDINHSLFHQQN